MRLVLSLSTGNHCQVTLKRVQHDRSFGSKRQGRIIGLLQEFNAREAGQLNPGIQDTSLSNHGHWVT